MRLILALMCSVGVLLSGCQGSGGGPGASLQARCEAWCGRRNADAECGAAITSCSGSCSAILASASSRCTDTVDAYLDCVEAASDLCGAGGTPACSAENSAIVACSTAAADGGVPACRIAGTYSGVMGGVPAMACGRMLATFSAGTLVVSESAGGVTLTMSGTSEVGGDTTACEGTVSECTVTATCTSGGGSTVRYELTFDGPGFSGMAQVRVGDCQLPYSISGRR